MRGLPYDIQRKLAGRQPRTPTTRADRRRSLSARANAVARDKRRADLRRAVKSSNSTPTGASAPRIIGTAPSRSAGASAMGRKTRRAEARRALNLDDTTPSSVPRNARDVPGKSGTNPAADNTASAEIRQTDSITGGIRRTPARTAHVRSGDDDAVPEAPIYTPRADKPWCTEHDKLVAPVLRRAHPDDIVKFRAKYLRYCEKVDEIREKHSTTTLVAKSVFNCIERANRYYICAVSDLLPVEHRGHPDDVDHTVIHDLVMNAHVLVSDSYAASLEFEVSKIIIDVGGKEGEHSIQKAWVKLYELKELYDCDVPSKTVIKLLLGNLKPKATRKVIKSLQKSGKTHQRKTATDIYAFHHWLVDIARTNRKAHEFNSCAAAPAFSGRGPTKQTTKVTRHTKRTTPSEAALAEGGCSHHGKDCLHGSSECWEIHPELAPEWYPKFKKRREKRNAKRAAKREAQRKPKSGKAAKATKKSGKPCSDTSSPDDDNSSCNDDSSCEEVFHFSARAYCMQAIYDSDTQSNSNSDHDVEDSRVVDAALTSRSNKAQSLPTDAKGCQSTTKGTRRLMATPSNDTDLIHTRMRLRKIAENETKRNQYKPELLGNQLAMDLLRTGAQAPFTLIKKSSLHGLGLFANTHIEAGTYLGRYHGEIIADLGHDEMDAATLADEMSKSLPGAPHNHLLMLRNDHGTMQLVDGKDTMLGCMNHSDTPNVHGNIRGEFTTITTITAGTELLINYNIELVTESSSETEADGSGEENATGTETESEDDSGRSKHETDLSAPKYATQRKSTNKSTSQNDADTNSVVGSDTTCGMRKKKKDHTTINGVRVDTWLMQNANLPCAGAGDSKNISNDNGTWGDNDNSMTKKEGIQLLDEHGWGNDEDTLTREEGMQLLNSALCVLGALQTFQEGIPAHVHRSRITGKPYFSNPNFLHQQAGISTHEACWMLPRRETQLRLDYGHERTKRGVKDIHLIRNRRSLLHLAAKDTYRASSGCKQRSSFKKRSHCKLPTLLHAPFAYALPTGKSAAIWDSGASHHLTGVSSNVTRRQKADVKAITDIQGNHSPVVAMGSLGNLAHVLVVPNATQTLLSVGCYLDQFGGSLTFTSKKVISKNQGTGARTVGLRQEDGLYYLMKHNPAPVKAIANLGKEQIRFQLLREKIHELHRCFGHIGKDRLRTVIQNNKIDGIAPHHVELLTECESCSLGKLNKVAAPKASQTPKVTTFGAHLASDNSGRLRVRSLGGSRYANITVCMATNWVWATPITTLQHTYDVLRHIIEVDLHQEHDHAVRLLRSDGGSDYCNTKVDHLLRKHGIERQTTCTETSHQNGKAERYVGVMFAMLRTLLYESRLPQQFWSEALCAAAYIHNRMPLSARAHKEQKSPYELRYGRPPDLSQLRPFGTRCTIVSIRRKRRGKHLPQTQKGIMVGYGYMQGKKGYRIYIPETKRIVITTNVRFATLFRSVRARKDGSPANLYTSEDEVVRLLDALERAADASTMGRKVQDTDVAEGMTGTSDSSTDNSDNQEGSSSDGQEHCNSSDDQEHCSDDQDNNRDSDENCEHEHDEKINEENHGSNGRHKHEVKPGQEVPKGWVSIPEDHPYLKRNKHVNMGTGETIAERLKSRRQQHANTNYVSDCLPNFLALSATAAVDMAEDHETPKTYRQAIKSKDSAMWVKAIQEELSAIKRMGCYVAIRRHQVPKGANIIGHTWVFKVKKNGDGTVARYKARVCCDGSRQKYGIDFDETFAPVANATTIRLVLAVATYKRLKLRQYDIKLAFVSTKIDRPVYMYQPTGGSGPKGTIWELKKSLYGLKQAPKLFNDHLHEVLVKQCLFVQSKHDPCLYVYRDKRTYSLLVLVVDDLLLATNNLTHALSFKQIMNTNFDFKDMGTPNYMIGMNLTVTKDKLMISQQEYIRDISKRFGTETLPPTSVPAPATLHLIKNGVSGKPESPPCNGKTYRSLVGALMYVLITRPDAATAISIAARFLHDPRQAHLEAAFYILRYLQGTMHMCLTYTYTNNPTLVGYCDASWADDRDSRRSRYGYLIFYGAGLVSWKSKLHASICLSTSEAEYVAATETTKEVAWLRLLLQNIGMNEDQATVIHEDNQACIKMATNNMVSARNKHLELKMHYVREQIQQGLIKLCYIPSRNQLADALTKNLPRIAYEQFRCAMLNPKPKKEGIQYMSQNNCTNECAPTLGSLGEIQCKGSPKRRKLKTMSKLEQHPERDKDRTIMNTCKHQQWGV